MPGFAGRRQYLAGCGAAVAASLLLVGGWVGVTGWLAKNELYRAAAQFSALQAHLDAGDHAGAAVAAAELTEHTQRARRWVAGPAWAAAAKVPGLGQGIRSARGMSEVLAQVSRDALPPTLRAAAALDPGRLRAPDGTVDLVRLHRAAPELARAQRALGRGRDDLAKLPAGTWAGPVDRARARVVEQLSRGASRADAAARALQVLPALLGESGTRRYLMVFQNNAEARGTGGLPGTFGVAEVTRGRIRVEAVYPDRVLAGAKAVVDLGAEYDRANPNGNTKALSSNANLDPHFPYAAAIWADMWRQRFRYQVDGVIALDPAVLSHLLEAIPPARLPDGTIVGAANVVALTQRDAYARFPGVVQDHARRAFLVAVADVVSHRLTGPDVDARALLGGLARSVAERRLLIWSAHPDEQRRLVALPVAGVVPVTEAPYVGLSIVNEAGNKLDYYLDRSLRWERTGCGPTRSVRVTVTLTNRAPATGLSEVVINRTDRPVAPVVAGDHRLMVSYLATTGALMESVTVDGRAAAAGSTVLRGHPMLSVDLELPRGVTRTIVWNLVEPAVATAAPIVLRQPLVRPLVTQISDAPCALLPSAGKSR